MLLEPQQLDAMTTALGEPISVPKHALGAEPFPDIQSEPPVTAPCIFAAFSKSAWKLP